MEWINKGMILAAGFGTRLRPITDKIPKALVEVGGVRLVEYGIYMFRKYGIDEIVINLHHMGNMIREFLGDGKRYGVKIAYSEEKEILGTAGGIRHALPLLGDSPFLVTNVDVIADVPIDRLILTHFSHRSVATLVVKRHEEGYTPISTKGGRVVAIGEGDRMYAGIQILEPSYISRIPDGRFLNLFVDILNPKEGVEIRAYDYEGFWRDAGDIKTLDILVSESSLLSEELSYL